MTDTTEGQTSYRIDTDDDQVRQEYARLLVLSRLRDPSTCAALAATGIGAGWRCCDVGSGAGTVAAWMAERVGERGSVVSIDVDTRFQPGSSGNLEVRHLDVTAEPIGDAEFDLVHARAVLEHLAQRDEVLDRMIAATKPGGWIVVSDADWVQFDAQPIPEPFATLSTTLRDLSGRQHGYDPAWGRLLVGALQARGLTEVDATGEVWTMHGGTDSAEWYVSALARVVDVLPADVFPAGLDIEKAIAQARDPDFAILSPISMTARGRRRV